MSSTSTSQARSGPSWLSDFSLVSVLAAAALLEIALYRVLRPVLRVEAELLPRWVYQTLEAGATFSFNLVTVLSVAVAGLTLGQAALRGATPGMGPAPGEKGASRGRFAFALVGTLYVPLSLLLAVGPGWIEAIGLGSSRALFLLQVSFVCLALLIGLSLLPLRGQGRLKLGTWLLILPLLLHFEVYFAVATNHSQLDSSVDLLSIGQYAAIGVALLSGLCFLPRSPGPTNTGRHGPAPDSQGEQAGRRFAGAAAGLVAAAAAGLILLDWEMAARLLNNVAGFKLPTLRVLQGVYVLAFFSFVYTTTRLLLLGGALQLRGFGLLLMGFAGYRVAENHHLALLVTGLLCIAKSAGTARVSPKAGTPKLGPVSKADFRSP